jgi:hypothetical protein
MRKLAVTGAVAAIALTAATGAHAATATYNINGSLSEAVNSCFNIAVSLTQTDCSYARTRSPTYPAASGPKMTAGFYAVGSTGDNVNYVPVPNDGKSSLGVTGTLTIDDNDTAGDPSDDLISFNWEIAAGVHNASTGNGDRALERWTKWTHVMAPTAVNAATAAGAGVEYVIGSRGKPTPTPLCAAGDATDCFATENAPATQDPPGFWDTTFSLPNPPSNRVGIERSPGFGLNGPNPLNPNVGGQTTGTFENYVCIDLPGDNDCIGSEILFGSALITYRNENGSPALHPTLGNCSDGIDNDGTGGTDAADPQCQPIAPTQPTTPPPQPLQISPPGFENVILVLTTDGANGLTAQAFWTREYIIASGPSIGTDADQTYNTNNSYGGGRITLTGTLPADSPTVTDDAVNVAENTATPLSIVANDTVGNGVNTITIVGAGPANGTITLPIAPGATSVTYTPDTNFSGVDTFDYTLTDEDGDADTGTVTVTVSERSPVAGNFNASSTGGNPTAAINVLNAPTVLGTGTSAEHTVTATGVATGGSCVATGSTVSFTPTAGFNGVGSCEFQVTDVDGQSDTGQLTVSVSGNSGGGGGGGGGPQLPSGGSSLDLLSLGALLAGLPLVARRRRTKR